MRNQRPPSIRGRAGSAGRLSKHNASTQAVQYPGTSKTGSSDGVARQALADLAQLLARTVAAEAWADRMSGAFRATAGGDNTQLVQTNIRSRGADGSV